MIPQPAMLPGLFTIAPGPDQLPPAVDYARMVAWTIDTGTPVALISDGSTWNNLKGPQGSQGSTGATGSQGVMGVRGSNWTTGAGVPTAPTANPGDQYLDTSTGDVWQFT